MTVVWGQDDPWPALLLRRGDVQLVVRCHCHGQGPLLSTLGNYLKWRFTDSHSDTTYQIQCRAIHTLHKLSMRCAACKEARYLSPSHSDCDSYFLNLIFGRIMLCVGMHVVQLYSTDHGIVRLQWLELLSNYITFQPVEDADAQNNFNEKYMRSGFENSLSPGHHDVWGIDRVSVCQALSSLDINDISYSISLPWG